MKQYNEVKNWYMENYEDDNMGIEISPLATFENVWEGMQLGIEFYCLIGIHDSIIRTRIFDKIAEVNDITYADVYKTWLNAE